MDIKIISVMNLPNKSEGYVLRFNPDGSIGDEGVFIADKGGVGKLNRPEGLVFGPDRNFYITSFQNNTTDTDSIRIYDGKTGGFRERLNFIRSAKIVPTLKQYYLGQMDVFLFRCHTAQIMAR